MRKLNCAVACLAVGLLGTTAAKAESLTINGKDNNWHVISRNLQTNQCYQLSLTSTVLYSATDVTPSGLGIGLRGAHKKDYTYDSKGGPKIVKMITFTATKPDLAVHIMDPNPKDNKGMLVLKLEPCPAK